jgi:hypothetical protein
MDAAALAGLCAVLVHGGPLKGAPELAACPSTVRPMSVAAVEPAGIDSASLGRILDHGDAREGIAQVASAEAANQGDSGLAAVVYTILNRLRSGRWGAGVDGVLDAPRQFEPVLRAGGSWRNLRPVTDAQRARIDTIINLVLEGRLPDLTNGARYFQNPRIVAVRAGQGQVAPSVVNFGGAAPSAVIGDHSFYVEAGRGGGRRAGAHGAPRQSIVAASTPASTADGAMFVGENRAFPAPAVPGDEVAGEGRFDGPLPSEPGSSDAPPGDPTRAIFVRADGRASAYRR